MRSGIAAVAIAIVLALVTPSTSLPAAAPELRGIDGLVRAYEAILEARFDQVDAELRRACGPAPREACDVLGATALWWRIQLDPASRALDPEFSASVDRAIETAEAWTEREPADAEAWFYLGAAYAARVQWRVLRDEKLAAARDGKQIMNALERTLELDAAIDDAYFGLGMYRYYADVAPAAARMLRFFLLLPGGDREAGLEQMLRARVRGRLLQGEADYQLSIIYLWYERQTDRALELLDGLRTQYPGNPIFSAQIAEIQEVYLHDVTASLSSWRALLGSAREQRSNAPVLAEAKARLEIARLLDGLHQTDGAIEQLRAVIALRPSAPFGALPLAHLRLGEAYDRIGRREAALAEYKTATTLAPTPDVHQVRTTAATRLRRAPDARRADAYRLSLEGWRRFEQNDLAGASASLEQSLAENASDPVTRYRMGRVMQARKEDPAALAQFEMAIRAAKTCPPTILGNAYLEAARLHERAARTDQALSYYRIASTLFGAASETHSAAKRALTRLDASTTPRKR
jgi:tetratricopeptide (TPR) repeat protein